MRTRIPRNTLLPAYFQHSAPLPAGWTATVDTSLGHETMQALRIRAAGAIIGTVYYHPMATRNGGRYSCVLHGRMPVTSCADADDGIHLILNMHAAMTPISTEDANDLELSRPGNHVRVRIS